MELQKPFFKHLCLLDLQDQGQFFLSASDLLCHLNHYDIDNEFVLNYDLSTVKSQEYVCIVVITYLFLLSENDECLSEIKHCSIKLRICRAER